MTGTGLNLGVGEGDLLALVLGRQVVQLGARALLDILEAVRREVAVGRPGQVQDRVGDLDVGLEARLSGADSRRRRAIALPQYADLPLHVVGTPLVSMPTFSISGPIDVILS
jgi:hypothetical protein